MMNNGEDDDNRNHHFMEKRIVFPFYHLPSRKTGKSFLNNLILQSCETFLSRKTRLLKYDNALVVL